ncbi:hypothetical protein [Flavobacterium sp.]|uniref:hypothetical protein n=1 Tax=Flavobacterium sp. TaxID=239 RepID=UPI0012036173|nr:hypothetical protein [Flavobacterium sp.]RZJ72389.1 MAG: hypothetical protein EOO49_05610 [Flavobacterium sp.]
MERKVGIWVFELGFLMGALTRYPLLASVKNKGFATKTASFLWSLRFLGKPVLFFGERLAAAIGASFVQHSTFVIRCSTFKKLQHSTFVIRCSTFKNFNIQKTSKFNIRYSLFNIHKTSIFKINSV